MRIESAPQNNDLFLQSLTPQPVEDVNWAAQQVQLAIARRAYELFEDRGREHGHDWEDWFQAESELLRPVSAALSETGDRISVRVNVFGFGKKELRIAIEPTRITIVGKKRITVTESEEGKIEYIDSYPDMIMKVIDLPSAILPENAAIRLAPGILIFDFTKASSPRFQRAAA